MSLDLLSVLSKQESYERFVPFVKEHAVSTEVWQIIKDMEDYFDTGEKEIDWQRFEDWFSFSQHPSINEKKLDIYKSVFSAMRHFTPSNLTDNVIEKLIRRDFSTKIADITLRGAEGDEIDLHDVSELLDSYNMQSKEATRFEDYFVSGDVEDVIESTTGPGLDWPKDEINMSCGPLRKGDLVVFAARPDAGKTTFAAWASSYFAKNSDKPVLWFNNEQEGRKVKSRFVQAAIGWTTSEMRNDPLGAKEAFMDEMGGRTIDECVLVFDKASLYPRDVEQVLRNREGCVIIFDQLWKFHGFDKKAGNEVSRQALLFQWAREICKEHAPVIALHQADGSAEGQEWIDMGQLYGSKTAIQGEADLLITMGRSNEPTRQMERYFQFPKNKMAGGGELFSESERHSRWEFEFNPMRARFEG